MKYVVSALYQKGNGIDQSLAEVEDLEKGMPYAADGAPKQFKYRRRV